MVKVIKRIEISKEQHPQAETEKPQRDMKVTVSTSFKELRDMNKKALRSLKY